MQQKDSTNSLLSYSIIYITIITYINYLKIYFQTNYSRFKSAIETGKFHELFFINNIRPKDNSRNDGKKYNKIYPTTMFGFIDYEKTFDAVKHSTMFNYYQSRRIKENYINVIESI